MRSEGYDPYSGEVNPYDRERTVDNVEELRRIANMDAKEQFKRVRRSSFLRFEGGWTVTSGYFTPNRQKTVIETKKALESTFRTTDCINFSDQVNRQGDIMVVRRIGSDSVFGQVYLGSILIKTDDPKYRMVEQSVAIKVMPVFMPRIYGANLIEIDVMYKLSQLVLEGKSVHFPVLYLDTACESTILPIPKLPKGILPRRAANFGLIEKLSESIGTTREEQNSISNELFQESFQPTSEFMRAEFESTTVVKTRIESAMTMANALKSKIIDTNFVYSKAAEKIGPGGMTDPRLSLNPAGHIRANIAVMELAESDVRSKYKQGDYKFRQSYDMVIQVMQGIIDMQRYYSLVHDDLHAGNVLIIKDIDELGTVTTRYLLNDFGRVKRIDQVKNVPFNEVRTMDIERFANVMFHYTKRNEGESREHRDVADMFQIVVETIEEVRGRPRRNIADDMITVLEGTQYLISDQFSNYLRGFKLYSPENILPLEDMPPTTVSIVEPSGRVRKERDESIEVIDLVPKRKQKRPRVVFSPRKEEPRARELGRLVKIINLRNIRKDRPIVISSSEEKREREVGKVAKAIRAIVL